MIKELVVLSGKGGTGKTSLTAAFSALSDNTVLCDADVDAADLHLLTAPDVMVRTEFVGGNKAVIDPSRCTRCGRCAELCRFDAIGEDFTVDSIACEGCGVCVTFCLESAIDFPEQVCGEWFVSRTRFGPMVHARLGIAEENSGRLVSLVRQEARKLAEQERHGLILTDGPPGVGCPVIASIGGATALCLVTEPTVSGIHDLERLLRLAGHFRVPSMVIINKYDLNPEMTGAIERLAAERDIPVVGRIPFDEWFVRSMVQARTVIEQNGESPLGQTIRETWNAIVASEAMNSKTRIL
jgi:MinD superfamily P-loop ATPase